MRYKICTMLLTMFLIAIACPFAVTAAPQPRQNTQGQFYMCRAIAGLYQAYVSGINPLDGNARDIQIAWQNYVNKTYGLNANANTAGCMTGTEAGVQQMRASLKQQMSIARNGKFVETDWKFTADQVAAASKPGAFYGFCQSGTFAKSTIYFSDIFEVPRQDAMSTNSPVDKTFVPYLNKTYGLPGTYTEWVYGSGSCLHGFANITDAQASKQGALDSVKKTNQHVVDTGWKYVRTADTPPAGPGVSK